jgi:ribosome recycling factor
MYKEIIKSIKPELDKVVAFLEKELAKIRTSQASPSLVEELMVDCFGKKLPLKQISAIFCPKPRQITIQPWDKSYLELIEKAIFQSNLGISPVVEKDLIRINLPALNEEFRKNLLKLLSERQEEARRTVRRWRENAWKEIQESFKQGKISEDNKFRGKDELQKLIDEYNKKIEEMGERKKKEIME